MHYTYGRARCETWTVDCLQKLSGFMPKAAQLVMLIIWEISAFLGNQKHKFPSGKRRTRKYKAKFKYYAT